MKKVLLSFLLALLCHVQGFACYLPIEASLPCIKTIMINGTPTQVITVFVAGDCYGDGIATNHGYLWYQSPGSTSVTGYLSPHSETYILHPTTYTWGWEITYIVPSHDLIPQHECALFWFEMWPDTHTPVTPPNSITIFNMPGTLVCPCDEEVRCPADFNLCVNYDDINAEWDITAAPLTYPTWVDLFQMTVDGVPVTTTMPGTYTSTGGTHTVCIDAYYYERTQSCKKCMDICFPAKPKPGKETTTTGQLNSYFSQVKLYPNPANNITNLEFNMQESEQMTIQLMDISGRVIKNIRSNEQADAGYHKVEINTADIPSGMYIIRMETGKTSVNYRLSVIK